MSGYATASAHFVLPIFARRQVDALAWEATLLLSRGNSSLLLGATPGRDRRRTRQMRASVGSARGRLVESGEARLERPNHFGLGRDAIVIDR